MVQQVKAPKLAYVLSLMGSLIILLCAIIELLFTSLVSLIPLVGLLGLPLVVLSIIGLVTGVVSLVLSIRLGSPISGREAHLIGVALLLLAILSLFTTLMGGFIIGFLLLLAGSILALTWQP